MTGKIGIWALLAAPAVWILVRFVIDEISYGQTIHASGQWSVGLLLAALAVTPLQRLVGSGGWVRFLVRHRRATGVASFGYAALHTIVYLERKWGADLILEEGVEPWLATGWLALFIFFVLALTSNTASVRMLRSRWKPLHRTVYLAAVLTFAHWILATFDPLPAYVCLLLIAGLEALRLRSPA